MLAPIVGVDVALGPDPLDGGGRVGQLQSLASATPSSVRLSSRLVLFGSNVRARFAIEVIQIGHRA